MNETKRLELLKKLEKGSPDEQKAAVRELEAACQGTPAAIYREDLARLSPEVEKRLEAAHRRSNLLRLVAFRRKIRAAIAFLFRPWHPDPNAEGYPSDAVTAELLEKTRAQQKEMLSAMKQMGTVITRLYEEQLKQAENLSRVPEALAEMWDKLTGDNSATSAIEAARKARETRAADDQKDIDELKRMMGLDDPSEKK